MTRWMSVVVAAFVAAGCTPDTTESASPLETVSRVPAASTFAGTWRSVTPSLEFVRLTVHSLSSQSGVLGARLTYSGVAWEGSGRIEGDAFVASMAVPGASGASGTMVVRSTDGQTLQVQMRPASGTATDLAFVREH